ncbi:MAG: PINc/VapC family ATPase [Nitrososphaerota archaeon]|nr:PINc/VapC family ATPase [Candidatus Geocrenenecus dongiae]
MQDSVKIVPDTSIIINGKFLRLLQEECFENCEIIIPVAVIDELQAQASKGRDVGFKGLEQLKKIREVAEQKGYVIKFVGERPSLEDIKLARSGRIDAIIRDAARSEKAILYTSDYVQALVAEAEGVPIRYVEPYEKPPKLSFEEYFTQDTLSLHLKVGVPPLAKRGKPGRFTLIKLREEPCTEEELDKIIHEIMEAVRISEEGSIEVVRSHAMVVQLGQYRIAIARPPFSDDLEVTIVRPIVKLSIQDYNLSSKLIERLKNKAEGILIAGPPGSGKTTFASSLAEFYFSLGKIVKTFESPRDLQVGPEITQYGPLEGDFEKSAELLLLVRPDYTIFDEIRKPKDFKVFSDMRLAGVGMIGVVHASDPIDAIQRFIGRVELGMIPSIIDTVIFLKYGQVEKVYELELVVKVPTGMTSPDLARPVIEVRDFESGELEYEIYTYGEENVVVPVSKMKEFSEKIRKDVEEKVLQKIKIYDPGAEVEVISPGKVVVRVNRDVLPKIVGRRGETISRIERDLGVSIDLVPKTPVDRREIPYDIMETGRSIEMIFPEEYSNLKADVYVNGEHLSTVTIGKNGKVRFSKNSELGRKLLSALDSKKNITVYLKE